MGDDGDAEEDKLALDSVTHGQNGTVTIVGDTVSYDPNANFVGGDWFTYTISDPNAGVTVGQVSVLVHPAGQWARGRSG